MKKIKTKIKDLNIYEGKVFHDRRGNVREAFKKNSIKKNLFFSVVSKSKKNVIRGLHLQSKKSQGKFISVIKGKIFDVAVDLRKNSKTFGTYYGRILSEKNSTSIFIPPGFAHGFQALEKENHIIYSCTQYRHAKSEIAIKFNDNDLNIKWPSKKVIVSKKDEKAMSFKEFKKIILK